MEIGDDWDGVDEAVKVEVKESQGTIENDDKLGIASENYNEKNWSEDESSDEDDNDPDYSDNMKVEADFQKSTEKLKRRHLSEKGKKICPNYEFACDIEDCTEKFKFRIRLMKHKLMNHGITDAINCEDCGQVFINIKELRSHLNTNHPKCNAILVRSYIIIMHGNKKILY